MKSPGKQWTDQLRSLSFTAIGTTQHDMDMDKGKLSKKIATTTGGQKCGIQRGGWIHWTNDQRPTTKDQGPGTMKTKNAPKDPPTKMKFLVSGPSFGVKLKLELKAQ